MADVSDYRLAMARRNSRRFIVVGALILLGGIVGLVASIVGMVIAANGDPETAATAGPERIPLDGVTLAAVGITASTVLGVLGAILLLMGLVRPANEPEPGRPLTGTG